MQELKNIISDNQDLFNNFEICEFEVIKLLKEIYSILIFMGMTV